MRAESHLGPDPVAIPVDLTGKTHNLNGRATRDRIIERIHEPIELALGLTAKIEQARTVQFAHQIGGMTAKIVSRTSGRSVGVSRAPHDDPFRRDRIEVPLCCGSSLLASAAYS